MGQPRKGRMDEAVGGNEWTQPRPARRHVGPQQGIQLVLIGDIRREGGNRHKVQRSRFSLPV
jgi:hypothetical protein